MAKKNNIRSIRFSDEMMEIIESQEGETFTAKFEALVFQCIQELPRKEQELEGIREQIKWERNQLRYIQDTKRKLENNLRSIEYQSAMFLRQLNQAAKDLESM